MDGILLDAGEGDELVFEVEVHERRGDLLEDGVDDVIGAGSHEEVGVEVQGSAHGDAVVGVVVEFGFAEDGPEEELGDEELLVPEDLARS